MVFVFWSLFLPLYARLFSQTNVQRYAATKQTKHQQQQQQLKINVQKIYVFIFFRKLLGYRYILDAAKLIAASLSFWAAVILLLLLLLMNTENIIFKYKSVEGLTALQNWGTITPPKVVCKVGANFCFHGCQI